MTPHFSRRRFLAGLASGAGVLVIFIKQANGSNAPSITAIAPYAAFGAFYFLVSAIWLTISDARRRKAAFIRD